MSDKRYVILTLDDAKVLAHYAELETAGRPIQVVIDRLKKETGADIEDIVARLKRLPHCHACVIEAQERDCNVHAAQKQGRRLHRLLERANGLRTTETEGH